MDQKKLLITETILRDAHQSLAATRMRTDEMLPAASLLDSIGYWSLEVWGGATFDTCLRFLNEDPWERLRTLRKAMPNTKLQMLLRGQNLLGYKHYSDDVVEEFVRLSIKNGIDVVRVFDALNDLRNMQISISSVKKYGGLVEAAISYTVSPVHDEAYFVSLSRELQEIGADTICIKDMAGLLLPSAAASLVKELKKHIRIPIHLHTHNTAGIGTETYLEGVRAGADIVDCALSPLGSGTSQPATESLVAALQGTPWDTGLDLKKLTKAAGFFKPVAERLEKEGFLVPGQVLRPDVKALIYQVPGGMLSNLLSQMKGANALDKYDDVLAEVPNVRADFGYPPLVTPTSQIVGTQAVLNVLQGERYRSFTKESKALLRGEYGRLPAPVNPVVSRQALGDEEPITQRPADLIEPEMEKFREASRDFAKSEEDVLSYALFPQIAEKFLRERNTPRAAAPVFAPEESPARVIYVEDRG
ncbi:MAG: pyruvate carboxylase subunit B [Eubacteriales bacterium]|jgi:oxaloacetate decarboxylase alpha subunit|nr:pyruvate carboxylase subunit B [Eubacteriales bacterium]